MTKYKYLFFYLPLSRPVGAPSPARGEGQKPEFHQSSLIGRSIYIIYIANGREKSGFKSMHVQISKWGNSLCLRAPRALAQQIGISEGAKVNIWADGSRLVVEAALP